MTPTTISHYLVRGELGRGGMGVVYKADDTKLDRTVALKVLPAHALTSEDDRARFYREARAAASLHHPHIATVFEIDEFDGQPFIAMEYVDGKCLDDRVAEGLLPLREAVDIAVQVAEALKAAHEKNIVHRDVKSGNVMLTRSGVAKVLDFGLAKTAASTKLTQMGSTLGTVAYMSPQQARGEDVDHRSDLWSLGAVLYEMISGKLPFPGDFEQAVIYSILNEDPRPLTSIRTGVPMGLEWIVTKLLAKNPDQRYQNAADLLVDLRTVDLNAAGMSRVSTKSGPSESDFAKGRNKVDGVEGGRVRWPVLAFAAGAILTAALWFSLPEPEQPTVETSVKRFEVSLPTRGSLSGVDLSPDGSKIAYADANNTVDNVHILDLSTGVNRTIEGSAGTILVSFSPDGEWILLTKGLSIERVPVVGGTPLPVTRSQEGTPRAGWGHGDWIVFENHQAIWKASMTTREVLPLTIRDSLGGEVDHDWPQMLPDGRTILATIEYENAPSSIGFWDIETGERRGQIRLAGYRARYLPTGHLLFVLSVTTGNLVALPFDLETLTATGTPIPVASNISTLIAAVSNGGTLVTGGRQGNESIISNESRLALTTFPSDVRPLDLAPSIFRGFELSPDGSRLVAQMNETRTLPGDALVGQGSDIWILDLERDTRQQLTFGGTGRSPAWTADGDSIVYIETGRENKNDYIVIRSADGTGEVRTLVSAFMRLVDVDISPDGTHTTYVTGQTDEGLTRLIVEDLRTGDTIDLSGGQASNIRRPRFSHNGRFVAYESGGHTWIREISGNGVPLYVGQSVGPRWSADGSKLYGTSNGTHVFYREVSFVPTLTINPISTPVAYGIGTIEYYDVFANGRAGVVNLSNLGEAGGVTPPPVLADTTVTVTVTVNWFETLK